jgi:hypothetical protein
MRGLSYDIGRMIMEVEKFLDSHLCTGELVPMTQLQKAEASELRS